MKRTTYLGALLVAILACTAALSTPRPAHAIMCCDDGGYTTDMYWAQKPTCSEAQSAFRALALPEAQAYCGGATRVCSISLPGCYSTLSPYGWEWEVTGRMTFGCKDTCPLYP